MIRTYLKERRSWIILFLCMQLLLLLIAFLDPSIPFQSILYWCFLSLVVFILFISVRYQKETKFYKSLLNLNDEFDLTDLVIGEGPFEKIVENKVRQQTNQYKWEIANNQSKIEQEKDDLLSWIHEVKTPLTTMQLMIDRIDNEALKTKITNEWLRIHLLLDQQLHQRRIPFIQNDLLVENTALEPLLFKEIKDLKAWCMQKGIGFEVSLQKKEVLTDAKWLSFMIRQLLTNAVKYSEHSDIMIKSYIEKEQTKLSIQDFGRGIDSKDLRRIYDKGFTSTTSHQDHAATGMGLYLTQKAAEQLFIHIDVQSKLGEGTTFTLTFPKRNEFVHIINV